MVVARVASLDPGGGIRNIILLAERQIQVGHADRCTSPPFFFETLLSQWQAAGARVNTSGRGGR